MAEIHLGDVGTSFRATINDDISTATVKKFIFIMPDGTDIEKAASFVTDGTDGVIEYVSLEGFLSQAGIWQYQVYIEYISGKYHTDILTFEVLPNLD